jgi:hypothetical protein
MEASSLPHRAGPFAGDTSCSLGEGGDDAMATETRCGAVVARLLTLSFSLSKKRTRDRRNVAPAGSQEGDVDRHQADGVARARR